MLVLTNTQMKEAEGFGINTLGVPSIILMENAALNVVSYVSDNFPKTTKIAVLCGKGNNGGDGFAIARGLFVRGFAVTIIPYGDFENATPDCKTNYTAAQNLKIPFSENYENEIKNAHITIDALIGTGLKSSLRPDLGEICKAVNSFSKYTIAVDCPTGVNSDTGEVYEAAVKADLTYTFHLPKTGLLLFPARDYVGKLEVGSIGIPQAPASGVYAETLTKTEAKSLLPKRDASSNKGSFGKVFAFSGSNEMTGAAVLNLKAALRSGAGLAYGVCTSKTAEIIHSSLTEAVTKIAPDKKGFLTPAAYEIAKAGLNNKSVVLAGSGLGVTKNTTALIKTLLENICGRLIIDADGLNCLSGFPDALKATNADIIITPHIGEMSRLCGKTISEIKSDPINTALTFAKAYNVTVVLKDAVTIIASPQNKVCINVTGCSAMSKGGSGDVLAGLIAGLSAQGLSAYDAASLGAYINGLAGEAAVLQSGSFGLLASETANEIPKIIEKL